MARTINSPGVQITEKDISLTQTIPTGTIVVVPGYAPQGPVSEPMQITTSSELERIYGTPSTPAEKYFHYTCREIINSPCRLTTLRLPYGEGNGNGYSNGYSALVYPLSVEPGAAAVAGQPPTLSAWKVGAPVHYALDRDKYEKLVSGNVNWADVNDAGIGTLTGGGFASPIDLKAGFVIVNDLQTTINEVGEGYYVGLADNLDLYNNSKIAGGSGSIPSFNSVSNIKTLTTELNSNYTTIDPLRLDFALSATNFDSIRGVYSVSENLQKVGFVGFETKLYQDSLSFGVFKTRRSVTDSSLLTLASVEKYLGTLDSTRKKVSPSGGILANAFLEEMINDASPTIKMYTNPSLSKAFDWTTGGTTPTSRITVSDEAKALFPIGIFTTDSRNAEKLKIIGDVPAKLDKALRLLENVENTELDLIVDAGLSTIHSTCLATTPVLSSFNDSVFINDPSLTIPDWSDVTSVLINFVENTRKDCFAIIDAPRSIFITGRDTKRIDLDSVDFNTSMYEPLKECAGFETNYAAMYGNWVKISDVYGGQRMWMPFSGYAAAAYGKSDLAGHQWAAPAGVTRGTFNALDIAINPNLKQRDRLYEISVNPVVYYQNDGYCIMGQKTLQTKPTAFDRINVRRLFLALERATVRTLRKFVFEPNTSFVRTKVKTSILPIFDLAKNTGGLYDFLIVSDDRNNTNETIENNELIVDIYVKPVKTAEFILVNFIATRTGQDFQELL